MADNFTPEQIEQFLREFFTVVGRRQYIGARYVPMFGRKGESSIEWDNSSPYEPLTVVTYQGMSYTSRTYVPTGVDIHNTEYWAATGNYDSQVEQYREEVQRLSEQVETFQGSIDDVSEVIPAEDFSDTNTVKKYIDDSGTAITNLIGSGFDATNTVRKSIDDITDLIGNGFSSSNTIANNIDKLNKIYSYFVTPEEYGAIGDGVTDDTTAFQQMFSEINDTTCVLLKPNATYYITQTLNISKNQIGIFSICEFESLPKIKFASNIGTGINATGYSLSLDSIRLDGASVSDPSVLLKFDRDNNIGNGNIDSYVKNCVFAYANDFIHIYGRNVKIHHNLFSQSNGCAINIKQTVSIVADVRGIVITDNRYHDVYYCVKTDVTQYSQEGCSIQIENNYSDGGTIFYTGTTDNVSIIGNYISRSATQAATAIHLIRTVKANTACVIANNFVNATQTLTNEYLRSFILITDDVKGIVSITNNVMYTAATQPHILTINRGQAVKIIINICGNTFVNTNVQSGIGFAGAYLNTHIFGLVANNITTNTIPNPTNVTVVNNVDVYGNL